MKSNMANIDKIIRVTVALLFGVLYFTKTVSGILGIVLLVVGGIFLLTSLVGFCPIYKVLGLSSKKKVA